MPAAPCAYGESQSINRPFGLGSFMSHVFTTKRESTKAYEYEKSTKFPGSRAHDMDAPQCSTCQEFNVAVVLSNQVMADPGAGCAFMPSFPKPVGGSLSGPTGRERPWHCEVLIYN